MKLISPCPFCQIPPQLVFFAGKTVQAFWNPYSTSADHVVVTTRRHVADWFALSDIERNELQSAMNHARSAIQSWHEVESVAIRMNAGVHPDTVSDHLHVHLMPNIVGDSEQASHPPKQGSRPTTGINDRSTYYDAIPVPHIVQQEALAALEQSRLNGHTAGLVVLATGLGKTWLSAFDSARDEFGRILYVAHREEILDQALSTFSLIQPDAACGYYTGARKDPGADILFASVQTLGRYAQLSRFAPDEFDYIVIDEFHHAAAQSYRRILSHFSPKFLLGLTATPERMDGQDLLALCENNLIYQCDLRDGIERGLLVPFHYLGVPDTVDYKNIPWRSGRFDEASLTTAVATQVRANNALEQYEKHAGKRTLAFCVSQRHANFMNRFFQDHGYRTVAVHSGPGSAPRTESLRRLEAGELDIIFSIDMFNEGLDLPDIDTVMMLRPTESPVIWQQQLGRGLRKAEGKERLTVIDYIGNHRLFLDRIRTLFNLGTGTTELAEALARLEEGDAELPAGCEVTYDLESIKELRGLIPSSSQDDQFVRYYQSFKGQFGVRPNASDMFHAGFDPKESSHGYASWLEFVSAKGDLTVEEEYVRKNSGDFLPQLERTPLTRLYKLLVILALVRLRQLPGGISHHLLAEEIQSICAESPRIAATFGELPSTTSAMIKRLQRYALPAWIQGAGTGGVAYFGNAEDMFVSSERLSGIDDALRDVFEDLVIEIIEWRMAQYFSRDRSHMPRRIVCNVSHSSGRPILFLPDRARNPGIPEGETEVWVGDTKHIALFRKIAVNVVHAPQDEKNLLPSILRDWFGEDAGQPGTGFRACFELESGEYHLRPVGIHRGTHPPRPWTLYRRPEIPALFGLSFSPAIWNQGIVYRDHHLILLVTLDKANQLDQHRYEDRFLEPGWFQWQSQNRTTRASKVGQAIRFHQEQNISVHLFVRQSGRDSRGKGASFYYAGELDFVDWEGEQPITVWWTLRSPIPKPIQSELMPPE